MASISSSAKSRLCKKERTFCFQGFAVVSSLSHLCPHYLLVILSSFTRLPTQATQLFWVKTKWLLILQGILVGLIMTPVLNVMHNGMRFDELISNIMWGGFMRMLIGFLFFILRL